MNINKYCKFLIYLGTNLAVGAVFLNLVVLLWLVFEGYFVMNEALLLAAKFAISAFAVWLIATAVLLGAGIFFAPGGLEKSNPGGRAFGLSISILVIALGVFFGRFLLQSQTFLRTFAAFVVSLVAWLAGIGIGLLSFRERKTSPSKPKSGAKPVQKPMKLPRKGMPPEGKAPMLFCPKCLKKTPAEEVYCRFCGRKLGAT